MKNFILPLMIFWIQIAFAHPTVSEDFLSGPLDNEKPLLMTRQDDFANDLDGILDVQEESFDSIVHSSPHLKLTQLVTSFSVSKSGLLGLSALGANSATTLFWNRKKSTIKEEVKSFSLVGNEDELQLQMKIDEVSDYLIKQNKVKNRFQLRENLEKVMRKGQLLLTSMENIESPHWRVGGYRLDLEITASGVVLPFTKLGENVRLWIEWTRSPSVLTKPVSENKTTSFVTALLDDIEVATADVKLPQFELQNLYVGLGQDVKTGFFGIGSTNLGFVGYVKFVKKTKMSFEHPSSGASGNQVNQENKFVRLSRLFRKRMRKGITRSLKFAEYFARRAEKSKSKNWELATIREIATITKSGFLGLSTLKTKGVFIFMFNRVKPQTEKIREEPIMSEEITNLTLLRLSFVTLIGYNLPYVANFEVRPNIEFFWK